MIIIVFLLIVSFVYLATTLLLLRGLSNADRFSSQAHESSENAPAISILLAARNEEHRLPACLDALLRMDYPPEKIEFVIVNDRSSDRTPQILAEFARRDERIHVITLTQRLPGMSGKASALCQGMPHARGEIILLTDADCIAPPHWASAMAAQFVAEVGLVGGFTLLSSTPALRAFVPAMHRDHLFAKIQTLDWMYLLAVGAGAAGLGKPVSILGNNFGFRRVTYEQSGGYEQLGFSIIEDFALMRKIVRETKWRVRFPLSSAVTLFSFPPQTWREFIEQRKRWAAGGKEVGAFAQALMLLAFLAHVAILPVFFLNGQFALLGLAIVWLADALLLRRCAAALQYPALLKYFPLFEIYFALYATVLAMTVIFPTTVRWKGMRYRWNVWGKIKSMEE